ncbi:mce related protein [Aquisphaera giovannonii]|uniref:Mce related protein n=1 Tax=Aquisphaera giovannonii TaxID=406548 RepID=A0A5B9WA74_9BACT|nr:MlaD family protein [Aquisphaera giovannonii]QEH36760.1 mce related protein [Aquisphaera giovannonii]
MSARRTTMRDVVVGLVVLAAVGGLLALMGKASDGPGFLARQKTVDVIFRDGQGIRVGSPVRVAGLDAGNVVDLDLVKVKDVLCARVRISLPANLLEKLPQDSKISISPGLTGMSHVNIVAAGQSQATLTPGQQVWGVESSFFDPIIEQVGLGPVERSHLSHTIAEVRETVDTVGPKLRQVLTTLSDTTSNLKGLSDSIRPAVENTIGHVEDLSRRIAANGAKIESTLARVESITRQADGILAENRENVAATVGSVRNIAASVDDVIVKDRVKVEKLLDGADMTRARADRVLYRADLIAEQAVQIVTHNRADIERSIANVRDATDWGNKLVQKIFSNPFVLSPFYKPNNEDLRVQAVYDAAQVWTKGAQEFNDAVKELAAVQAQAKTPEQQQEVAALQAKAMAMADRLNMTSAALADGLKRPASTSRRLR